MARSREQVVLQNTDRKFKFSIKSNRNMSSIVTAVFKATIGLLVNKGRDLAAERLKDGDVTDQQFRNLIVREMDDIKSKLDGLARKDFKASISFFKEGVGLLYQLFDQATGVELATVTARAATGAEKEKVAVSLRSTTGGLNLKQAMNTLSLAQCKGNVPLTELDEPAKQTLSDAKERFKVAREDATRAFNNEALKTSDRILAMTIRVMATLLEKVDNPTNALSPCRDCLDELHSMPTVQNSFKVEIMKPILKSLLNKNERREVIANVVQINFVIHDVTRMVTHDSGSIFTSPSIDIGKEKIDPLRDGRVTNIMRELDREHCCIVWSFGQEGEEEHRLREPTDIATNTQGQFIVADKGSKFVKVFNTNGKFLYFLRPPIVIDDGDKELKFSPWNVATDGEDNVYVLAILEKGGWKEWQCVYVFDQHADLHHKIPLKESSFLTYWPSVTVNDHHQVFVTLLDQVAVYGTDGRFVHSLGVEKLMYARGIAAANNDQVLVLSREYDDTQCVHVYSARGDHLHQFNVKGCVVYGGIVFDRSSEHVVVSSWNPDNDNRGQVLIYTKDGDFVHSVQLDTEKKPWLLRVAVTLDGRIAVTSYKERKVYVL